MLNKQLIKSNKKPEKIPIYNWWRFDQRRDWLEWTARNHPIQHMALFPHTFDQEIRRIWQESFDSWFYHEFILLCFILFIWIDQFFQKFSWAFTFQADSQIPTFDCQSRFIITFTLSGSSSFVTLFCLLRNVKDSFYITYFILLLVLYL